MVKIDGIDADSIQTDTNKLVASFQVDPNVDYKAKLTEFAKTNEHLAEFTVQ
ncbi:MAG: hypothetical protein QGG36_06395 [Pirellulaceae bacterium]|nr:hypothetical protein [Pirellulaceae bacterium]